MITLDLGRMPYQQAWDLQKQLVEEKTQSVLAGSRPEHHLLLVEHPHVYTFGKSGKAENLLIGEEELQRIGAEVYRIERGGDITYHGPGQLVAYPIFDLHGIGIGVKEYIWRMEEAIIRCIAHWGIVGKRIDGLTGIWLEEGPGTERKIAAIGVKVSRGITMHGLALNVNTDLSMFRHIVPCGIDDKDVTSIQRELGREIPFADVKDRLETEFRSIFEMH